MGQDCSLFFSSFEQTFLPKDSGFVSREDKRNKIGLPPIGRGMEGKAAPRSFPQHRQLAAVI